jgi:hypothetical protein
MAILNGGVRQANGVTYRGNFTSGGVLLFHFQVSMDDLRVFEDFVVGVDAAIGNFAMFQDFEPMRSGFLNKDVRLVENETMGRKRL